MSEKFGKDSVGTSLAAAVQALRCGEVVAFPTETSYGLAVDPFDVEAVQKIYKIKKRRLDKPLLLLVQDVSQLLTIVEEVPVIYEPLIKRFWPGPLTLLFPVKRHLIGPLTGGGTTIGVRISPQKIARQFIEKAGHPITATSANITGSPPATSAQEVLVSLGQSVAYILEADEMKGQERAVPNVSTIVGYSEGKLSILRKGAIASTDILQLAKA